MSKELNVAKLGSDAYDRLYPKYERLKKISSALLKAGKALLENSRHGYSCPEKYGHACNCGFDEMCKNWIKAEGDAEAGVRS